MPRTARSIDAGKVYHVLDPGNSRMRLSHKDGDYEAFERVLTEGFSRYPSIGDRLGLEFTLRGLARPRKTQNNQ